MSLLEPPPLTKLAEHMRDGTWLDVRVVNSGLLERVLIEAIIIQRESDDLDLRQEWLDDGEVCAENYTVDCEDIMRAAPTAFDLEDVEPYKPLPPKAKAMTGWDGAWFIAKHAAAFALGMDIAVIEEAVDPDDWDTRLLYVRYLVMLVHYEISDESEFDICRRVGYLSITPILSARSHWKRTNLDKVKTAVARALDPGGATRFDRPKSLMG